MAPVARAGRGSFGTEDEEEEYLGIKGDRKTRKPLVEKKRRARINESLQELRNLLTDTDLQAKMENAEVLELTVKRVENILRDRSQEADLMSHEASERFAAGYIQCMHEVHTFVSSCPGIDATVAAELLNHLLESMPLNEEHLHNVILDLMSDPAATSGAGTTASWPLSPTPSSPGGGGGLSNLSVTLSPTSSTVSSSSEELCSDQEETDSESSPAPTEEERRNTATITYTRSMWRPW